MSPGEEVRALARERDQRGFGQHAGQAVAFEQAQVHADVGLAEAQQQAEGLRERRGYLAFDHTVALEPEGLERAGREHAEAEAVLVRCGAEDVQPGLFEHALVEFHDLDFDLHGLAFHAQGGAVGQRCLVGLLRQGRLARLLVLGGRREGALQHRAVALHVQGVGGGGVAAPLPHQQRGAARGLAGDDEAGARCTRCRARLARDHDRGDLLVGDGDAVHTLVDHQFLLRARGQPQEPVGARAGRCVARRLREQATRGGGDQQAGQQRQAGPARRPGKGAGCGLEHHAEHLVG